MMKRLDVGLCTTRIHDLTLLHIPIERLWFAITIPLEIIWVNLSIKKMEVQVLLVPMALKTVFAFENKVSFIEKLLSCHVLGTKFPEVESFFSFLLLRYRHEQVFNLSLTRSLCYFHGQVSTFL